jgi:hypothetical protein
MVYTLVRWGGNVNDFRTHPAGFTDSGCQINGIDRIRQFGQDSMVPQGREPFRVTPQFAILIPFRETVSECPEIL